MAMATSRFLGALLVALVAALALASCGGGGGGPSRPSEFAWLHPRSVPADWSVAELPSGIAIAYPGTWRRIASDPGTVSAAQVDARGLIVGDLNATPRQADEALSNWATFRPNHNAHEGDRHVRVLAAARALPFRFGRASCVIDTYRTSRAPHREIACLVDGARRSTVIVAAATTGAWPREHAQLERAIQAFHT
jgi:hypothetical protein